MLLAGVSENVSGNVADSMRLTATGGPPAGDFAMMNNTRCVTSNGSVAATLIVPCTYTRSSSLDEP